MSTAIIFLVVVMIATQITGFVYTRGQQQDLIGLRQGTRELRIVQQALVDARGGVEDYLLTNEEGYLQSYLWAVDAIESRRTTALRALDDVTAPQDVARGQRPALVAIDQLENVWREAIALARSGKRDEAQALLIDGNTRQLVVQVRGAVARYLDITNNKGSALEERISNGSSLVMALQATGGVLTLICLIYAFYNGAREARGRREAMNAAIAARRQVETLFEMTDMLQSASGYNDANAVLRATADRLLPDFGGELYIFNNSRDRLDLATSWDLPETVVTQPTVSPNHCWALKRGKPHINRPGNGALHCEHHKDGGTVLEMPMMARGEVFGLLRVHADGADAADRLESVQAIATALGDAMSLALSNIALREKLRNQALRDPLTGLYNRRFMEDTMDRLVHLADRNQSPIAAVMIDLDHFKALNDQHGHAMGDTVLRAAATAITSVLRQSDVACRYGGEELIVILPDCDLDGAEAKAETLRQRIEALSDVHGARITASFGVAAIPETANQAGDLITMADTALYRAKQAGRNRVMSAPRRSGEAPSDDGRGEPDLLKAAE
ncbi:diguanylate cyclase [Flavisphingomonas formosensis]|uniref:diguanylate cyclase n=1 Tax=Flavisphingomonas formosensis TaxID=861534 RepID=UPI0018DF595B|nr:diguanylate cyclase [Sphingomonas formosensis]